MRISIDATGLGESKTGTAVYLTEILSAWNQWMTADHEFILFATSHARRHIARLRLDERFRFVAAPDHRHLRALWQQVVMPWHIERMRVDVHWGAGFVLPLLARRPMVVTVHDLTFQLFPDMHERVKRYYFPPMIKAAVKKAEHVLAVSETTRDDLHRMLPASRAKTDVTPLAARTPRKRHSAIEGTSGRDTYLLFVGTLEPRKNLKRLIAAWRSIDTKDRGGVRLVIVGANGWLLDDYRSKSWLQDEAIEFKGFVEDEQLFVLMRRAMAFVYPSLYEGFGLPVLEAMASGVPVLTSNVGATSEVAQDAALLVDPDSTVSIRGGLLQMLQDDLLRRDLSQRGIERAACFSWRRTAAATLGVIERAAAH